MADIVELKKQIKEVLYEFFTEDKELFRNIISEIMEDIAMEQAIKEGDKGNFVDEDIIKEILQKDK